MVGIAGSRPRSASFADLDTESMPSARWIRATSSSPGALSPADLARMNVNLVGGDPYGGACTLDQFFLFRPFAHSTNGSGALRGLIHIGASTHPGPGLGGGSGFLAAKRLGA